MMRPASLVAAAFAVLPVLCQAQGYLITTVAGGGVPLTPALAINVSLPSAAIAADAHGNVYLVAFDSVFKMDAAGVVTRVAGTSPGYSGDGGLATNAQLFSPFGLALDSGGNLYIADSSNDRIRKVTPGGTIATVPSSFSSQTRAL